MKSLFSEFAHLWPESNRETLKSILAPVDVLRYPQEKDRITSVENPEQTVVVADNLSLREAIALWSLRFEHCIQTSRADFPQELLASALMTSRPQAYAKNPIPFFFSGFQQPKAGQLVDTNMSAQITGSSDKHKILERLTQFLNAHPRTGRVEDLCIQTADELITNAVFSAPVNFKGDHMYQDSDRRMQVFLPQNKTGTFFAAVSDQRVIIGCEDRYGSLTRSLFLHHAESISSEMVAAKGLTRGAGLGFKFMISNAANFYLYSERTQRTLIACSFLLTGLEANLNSAKHLHCSFR